ncbi:hypothetical protein DPSP01_007646 [Paraphaeosphaeria sporulosa]|uniref:Uncharacterized protein n=1 Tax=Paraphaeosphaeria sporulosa TaxID=1460663 RepID=A0A177CCF5_9PLEO|nr:uncharacterized protein CC84DRAFT_1121619 [Paraphaeosphaeria sporulosa]OAG04861.1 hypothetical protein CC84DRAFT_1121619 [Paraphaeosphaeria sporulosa]
MHSIRRSCRAALLDSTHVAFLANGPHRAFSRSAALHRGALPVFLEASSPELSQLLATLNARVLLPHHLTPEQERLVYKPENRTRLEQEPIDITLGDVTLPLEHLDRNKDMPAYRVHLRSILKASKTPDDWENVVRALEGYHNAGLRLRPDQQTMAVRLLNRAGMQHLILKLAQRAKATGLRLRNFELIVAVLRSVRDKAWQAGWEKEDLRKALSMAEQIVELMENEEHLGHPAGNQQDYRTHPTVVAVPLEMAAELAYRHEADAAKVKRYASRLMNALKQQNFLAADMERIEASTTKTEADFSKGHKQMRALAALHNDLCTLIPIWNSLSTARTVLDADMPMAEDAERVQRRLRELLQKGEDAAERLRKRGGEELASADPEGYAGYVKTAIQACEEDADEAEE